LTHARLDGEQLLLRLVSAHPPDGVMLAAAGDEGREQPPVAMLPAGVDGLNGSLEMPQPDTASQRLHRVASTAGVLYLGDAATSFMQGQAAGQDG
jgi:hypothetical protein